MSKRVWWYRCDGLDPELVRFRPGIGLAEVRAMRGYGEQRRISSVEAARWRELLDCEAGILEPRSVDLPIPDRCPKSARILAAHVQLLVGLRNGDHFPLNEPFVFAHDFARAYTGLSSEQVREHKRWLERNRKIFRAEDHSSSRFTPILWRLSVPALRSHDGGVGGHTGRSPSAHEAERSSAPCAHPAAVTIERGMEQ
jgi:hypothetical protein